MGLEYFENISFAGSKLINFSDFGEMFIRLSFNLIVVYLIVCLIFYPKYKNRNFSFTYILINLSVFFVCMLLSGIKLKIGFAFGLFAVFSIIRYRTEQIPIKEMTYLFIIIIVAVLNAMSIKKVSYAELVFTNMLIVFIIYILEKNLIFGRDITKTIKYEKIELIKTDRHEELISDLNDRTGLNIQNVEIQDINFLNDTAMLKIFCRESKKVDLKIKSAKSKTVINFVREKMKALKGRF